MGRVSVISSFFSQVQMTTPAEVFVFDLYVHRDASLLGTEEGADAPEVNLYSLLPGAPPYPLAGRERGRLPLREPLIDLGGARSPGGGAPDAILPEFARYNQAVEMIFTRLGWSASDFHGYRPKMRYPPIPALAVLRTVLPERVSK
jgi:hypothetical protein